MLSFNGQRANTTHRVRVALAAVVLGLTAAGCTSGFQPMNAASLNGADAGSERLAQVRFATIPGRVGQKIRNELIFAATGGDADIAEKAYRLDVAIKERTTTALVSSTGDSAARIYNLDATFQLVSTTDNSVLLRGTSNGRAAVQRYSAIYSNVRSLRDAQDRAARTVARDLRGRIETFLATQRI